MRKPDSDRQRSQPERTHRWRAHVSLSRSGATPDQRRKPVIRGLAYPKMIELCNVLRSIDLSNTFLSDLFDMLRLTTK
jgi:hypothetical protein